MAEAPKPVDVRLAVPEDRDAIIALTTELHGENGLFPRSEPKVQAMLDRHFNRERAIIGVIGPVGAPVATIYLDLTQVDYSDDWVLIEQFNFVHPDHRRSNYARQLIAYAKEVSDKLEMPLMIGILSNQRTEAKVRLYEQLLEKAGAYFIYNRRFSSAAAWGE